MEFIHNLPAAWDIMSALGNMSTLAKQIGGALIILIGTIAIVWAAVHIFVKLFSENSRKSWIVIGAALLLGGLAVFGGIQVFMNIAEGGRTTIEQIGQ